VRAKLPPPRTLFANSALSGIEIPTVSLFIAFALQMMDENCDIHTVTRRARGLFTLVFCVND
jgi:hypothetical protein